MYSLFLLVRICVCKVHILRHLIIKTDPLLRQLLAVLKQLISSLQLGLSFKSDPELRPYTGSVQCIVSALGHRTKPSRTLAPKDIVVFSYAYISMTSQTVSHVFDLDYPPPKKKNPKKIDNSI